MPAIIVISNITLGTSNDPFPFFFYSTKFKRIALGFSIFLILVSCGSIFVFDGHVGVIVSKTLSCVAATLIAPTINAITLGMVGQIGFAERLGRNEAWNHAGNAFTAILGGFFWLHLWNDGGLLADGCYGPSRACFAIKDQSIAH